MSKNKNIQKKICAILVIAFALSLISACTGNNKTDTETIDTSTISAEKSVRELIVGTWEAESDLFNDGKMVTTTIVFRDDGFGNFSTSKNFSYGFEWEVNNNTVSWEFGGKAVYDYDKDKDTLTRFSDGLVFTRKMD